MGINRVIPASLDSGQSIRSHQDRNLWAAVRTPSRILRPPLPTVRQHDGTQWCWAVVVSSIHNHQDGADLTQYDVVERARPYGDCRANPTSDVCAAPDEVASYLADYGNGRGGPLPAISWTDVQREIERNNPIAAIVSYLGGAHAVVICGWVVTSGRNYLMIMDPQTGAWGVPFDEFTAGYPPGGTWEETDLTKSSRR